MSGYLRFYAAHPALQRIAEAINDAGDAYHHTMDWQDKDWLLDNKKSRCEAIQEAFADADAELAKTVPSQNCAPEEKP